MITELERQLQRHRARLPFLLFGFFLAVRLLFKLLSGYDNFELHLDSGRYDDLSDRILRGDFNLDVTAFITAPLYPYFLAAVKWMAGTNWQLVAVLFQLSLVSLSGVYLFRLALVLFQNLSVAILGGLAYALFPMTLWLNFTFTQETFFQSFLIIAVYYLMSACLYSRKGHFIVSAVVFSLAFLTKSHILLFSPFLVAIIFISSTFRFWEKVRISILYAAICLTFTLPYGLYNLRTNGVYTLSSYGAFTFFHNGKSEVTYQATFNPPPLDSEAFKYGTYLGFIFDQDYEYERYGKVNQLPHAHKDRIHLQLALDWIRENPGKFWRLEWFSLHRFFTPGLSYRHYSFGRWLSAFLFSFPVYLFAYAGIAYLARRRFRRHAWILFLILTMLLFYLIFSPQSRFRTITLEPFYLLYASWTFLFLFRAYPKVPRKIHACKGRNLSSDQGAGM